MSADALKLPVFAGSVAAALFLGEAGVAMAQETGQGTTISPGVEVKGRPVVGYKADDVSIVKLTQPVIDTPQMLTITPRQVIEDRGATSLTDVFRNSSGVSIGAGESSWQGTNLSIRGFNARNDLYLDGMRDFGSYTRDPFDLEEVELLQGPSSILFGRGSTGGAINQVSKEPILHSFVNVVGGGGTDALGRGTLDVGGPIPDWQSAAFRLNAMAHTQDFADRDKVRYSRWGLAPSFAYGLGTDTRLVVSYFHQQENDRPDYGLPYLRGMPAPVPRNNYYGFTDDFLHTTADVGAIRVEHDFTDDITLRDQIRYASYGRQWRDMEPQVITTGLTPTTPLSAISVKRALQGGHSQETFLQNQMDLTAKFDTAFVEHTLAAGWEIGPEASKPTYDNGLNIPTTSLLSPNENRPFSGTEFAQVRVVTTAFTVGAYLIDTLKFGPHWELSGGVRWDDFDSHYRAQFYSAAPATLGQPTTHQDVHQVDEQPSWRGSLVYKPVPNGSIYFDYSTSFDPSAEALSQITAVRSLNTGNIGLAPEENETFEFGTKWNLLTNRLQLQAAIFRETKENARVPDPADTQFNILAGTQQVDGFELELAGQITPQWQVTGGYTYLDGKTIKTVPGGPPLNSPLFNAPDDSLALWTTYKLPYRVEVGAGVNYLSTRYASLTTKPFTSVPGYTTLDLMVKWQVTERVRFQVNLNNVTDAYYYDQIHGFHVIPGEGRNALFTIAYSQ
jgi:catecholate siderophore receptor